MNQPLRDPERDSNLTAQAYATIRGEILACRLRPGAKLSISALCKDFGFSLGAVREALSRLSAEDLVEAERNKGFRVAPVGRRELEDLTRTRILMETECLKSAIENGDLAWEREVVSTLFELSRLELPSTQNPSLVNPAWMDAHQRFHEALVAACDSRWMLRMRETLSAQLERYRALPVPAKKHHRDLLGEHKAIADAALARDTAKASTLMRDHLLTTMQILIAAGLVSDEPNT